MLLNDSMIISFVRCFTVSNEQIESIDFQNVDLIAKINTYFYNTSEFGLDVHKSVIISILKISCPCRGFILYAQMISI